MLPGGSVDAPPPDVLLLGPGDVETLLPGLDLATPLRAAMQQDVSPSRFREVLAVPRGSVHVVGGAHAVAGRALVGVKVNGRFETGRMSGTMLLSDARSGAPLALLDSRGLTGARTAAMVALVVEALRPTGASSAVVVGAGRLCAAVVGSLLDAGLSRVGVWARRPERAAAVLERGWPADPRVRTVHDLPSAARAADVVVTATSARSPVLERRHIRPGALVVAVGSDAPTKQELPPDLLAVSAVVVDSLEQCLAYGEVHHAVASGLMTADRVRADLATVLRGSRVRRAPDETVVVDLTGIALQDIVAAAGLYDAARTASLGLVMRGDSWRTGPEATVPGRPLDASSGLTAPLA